MRQFRKLIAIAVAAASVVGARADAVSSELALAAANAWVAANPGFGARGAAVSAEAEYDGATLMWWVVRLDGGGAVFVAPETSIDPVLVAVPQYADALPAAHPLRAILMADVANRRSVIAAASATVRSRGARASSGSSASVLTNAAVAAAVSAAANRWAKLTTARPRARDVEVLMPTTNVTVLAGFGDEADNMYRRFWNQSVLLWPMDSFLGFIDPCFNLYTPSNAVCGCVATAGAAILQYFEAPGLIKNVRRECTYNGAKVALTTISATNHYDWSILPTEMGGQESKTLAALSDEEQEAVASLLGRAAYDMGVCVEMEYTLDGSGANTLDIAKVLVNDFGFHHAKADSFTTGTNSLEIAKAITNSICRLKRPVALSIRGSGGHAVLGVGYGEDEDGMPYTRLFMGWGGTGDAWYNLPEIKVAAGAGYHVFNLVRGAVTSIALKPPLGSQTLAETKAAALESHKPILLISGTEGEPLTDDLINYILTSANDYTNKFEIYFADYETSPHADQNPSYGVFSPLSFNKDDEENRWAFFNGRLSYFTNETEVAAVPAEVDAVLNEGLEKWEEEYAQHLHDEAALADGISLNVVGTPWKHYYYDYDNYYDIYYNITNDAEGAEFEFKSLTAYYDICYNGVSGYLVDELYQNDTFANVYTNGEIAVISAPCEFSTNENKVVWQCVGWELYDVRSGDMIADGDGTNATFAVSADTRYDLCWIWEPDAVKVTTSVPKGGGTVTPDVSGGVWLEYGTTTAFVATPVDDGVSQFDSWKVGEAYGYVAGSAANILAITPCDLRAYFKQNADAQSYTLTISNECYATYYDFEPIENPPAFAFTPMFGDRPLENGDNTLLEGPMAVSVPEKWTDSTGGVWQCVGWTGTNSVPEYGSMNTAGFNLTTNSVITWQWVPTTPDAPTPPDPPIGPVEGGVTNSALVIYATNGTQLAVETRVSNAKAGFWYSIWSADEVDGQYSYVAGPYDGTAKQKVVEPVPELLVLTIVFDPVAAAKFYRVVATEEDPEN